MRRPASLFKKRLLYRRSFFLQNTFWKNACKSQAIQSFRCCCYNCSIKMFPLKFVMKILEKYFLKSWIFKTVATCKRRLGVKFIFHVNSRSLFWEKTAIYNSDTLSTTGRLTRSVIIHSSSERWKKLNACVFMFTLNLKCEWRFEWNSEYST